MPYPFSSGEILTATNLNNALLLQAGGIMGYGAATSNQGSISVETAMTGITTTFTAVSGRRYKVTAQVNPSSTVAGDAIWFYLKAGAAYLQQAQVQPASAGVSITGHLSWVSDGSHSGSTTWALSMVRASGTGTITNNASAANPSFILVEDMGT